MRYFASGKDVLKALPGASWIVVSSHETEQTATDKAKELNDLDSVMRELTKVLTPKHARRKK